LTQLLICGQQYAPVCNQTHKMFAAKLRSMEAVLQSDDKGSVI